MVALVLSLISAPATPVSTPYFEPDPLLHDLLAVSLTALNLLRPCYSPTGELDDFAHEYFNPAAQRLTGLPERPARCFPIFSPTASSRFTGRCLKPANPVTSNATTRPMASTITSTSRPAAAASGRWLASPTRPTSRAPLRKVPCATARPASRPPAPKPKFSASASATCSGSCPPRWPCTKAPTKSLPSSTPATSA